MKKIVLIIILISVIGAGCTADQTQSQNGNDNIQTFNFSDSREQFSMSYPDWEKARSDDPVNNITLTHNQCSFALNIVDAPEEWYEKAVENFVIENKGTILSTSPLSYTLSSGKYTFQTRTASSFCDDRTYFVFFSCLQNQFDEKTAQEIFNSMSCTREWETPKRENKKLGLVVNPRDVSDIKSFYSAYNMARDSNVQITHHYASWSESEEERNNNDFIISIMKNKGLKVSLVFEIIHTSVIGKMPEDIEFRGWDDPVLISRFSDFAIDYIERHKDSIEYVEIGNEVDIYFNNHPDELKSYKIFYQQVYSNIKKAHPDIKIGTVFAYHEMKNNNNFEVYNTLSPIGDFDAFTLYIYSPGFIFDRDPALIYSSLKEIEKLTGNRNFAMEEVGWNAYKGLGGSEDDQQEAVAYFFDYLEEAPERLEFMNWFILHDSTAENCLKSAETFLEPDDPIIENDKFMGIFSDFLCYLGLIKSDGTPRPGWEEFTKRAYEYNNN